MQLVKSLIEQQFENHPRGFERERFAKEFREVGIPYRLELSRREAQLPDVPVRDVEGQSTPNLDAQDRNSVTVNRSRRFGPNYVAYVGDVGAMLYAADVQADIRNRGYRLDGQMSLADQNEADTEAAIEDGDSNNLANFEREQAAIERIREAYL